MKGKILPKILVAVALIASSIGIIAQDDFLVFKNDEVVFSTRTQDINQAVMEENNTKLCLYDNDNNLIAGIATADIDSIRLLPEADVLNVKFNADGTATDISPMNNVVENFGTKTYYSHVYGGYVATFDNAWAGSTKNYFKVDFTNNEAFKAALANGHTLEAVVMADCPDPIPNGEAKFFSSHEAGGTGLMLCKTGNSKNGGNEFTFLPNVSANGKSTWRWGVSGVQPVAKKFYHIVGVWNKAENVARIYVDGVLMNTVETEGDINLPKENSRWFAIGCDSGPSAQLGWIGDVAVARIYSKPLSESDVQLLYETVAAKAEMPVVDVLDVKFKTDGTAEDVSAMHNAVESHTGAALTTYYSSTYNRYVARFANSWAGSTTGYYKIDYTNNEAVKAALADGHTLEAVVMADYPEPIPNGEAKFFSSHEAGGTGMMICKTGNGKNGLNELTFLPNVSTNGKSSWRWATTGVQPQKKQFYHIVGVWDKEAGVAKVYLDGELMNTVSAQGNLNLPKENSRWFAIGCDSGPSAQLGWIGDVAVARVYDAALTEDQIAVLSDEYARMNCYAVPDLVTEVSYISGITVKEGGEYSIIGTGFAEGDKIKFVSVADESQSLTLDAVLDGTEGVNVTVPVGCPSGTYRMFVVRGAQQQDLGITEIYVVTEMPQPAEVIAHRGHWRAEGAAQNSRASLNAAIALNAYGSETDVWMTTDGKLVINHDATIGGVTIQDNTYDAVKNKTLSNGEVVPQLDDFLNIIKESTADTKLIIEIKSHSTAERNRQVATLTYNAVKDANLLSKVEFIAFDLEVCKTIVNLDNTMPVAYLAGGKTPAELNAYGIKGIDYAMAEFDTHPEWIEEAKALGMTVNVWTVNNVGDMFKLTNAGVQYITTDYPEVALLVKQYFIDNK